MHTAPAHATRVGGHLPGSREYRRVVIALFAAGVATFALLYSTQAVLPGLASEFGVSTTASTLTLSLTTLALGATLLVAGPASDILGRTTFIHVSMVASAVVALACALAPSWHALLGLRLLQGVALAGLPAVATAYLREELHPSTHARVAGLYIGGTALGGMAGRLVSAPATEAFGWRWGLASTALLAAACAVVVARTLPASRGFSPAPADPRAIASGARRALRDPALLALYAVGACSVGALVAVFNTLGFRLTAAPFHLGLGAAGLVYLAYPLGTVSSAVSGRVADRFGRRAALPGGCAVGTLGALLTLSPRLSVVVAGLALLVVGFFAVHGVASGWVPARAHAGGVATGQAASLYLVSYYLGSSVFGSLAGVLWTDLAWPGVVALAGVLLAVTGALALGLRRTPSLLPPVSGAAAGPRRS